VRQLAPRTSRAEYSVSKLGSNTLPTSASSFFGSPLYMARFASNSASIFLAEFSTNCWGVRVLALGQEPVHRLRGAPIPAWIRASP